MTKNPYNYLEIIISILRTYSQSNQLSDSQISELPISSLIQDSLDLLEFAMKLEELTKVEIRIEYLDTTTTPLQLSKLLEL